MSDNRKLERTKHPGIYKKGGSYVVRWKNHKGESVKQSFRTLALAREKKGKVDSGHRQATSRETVGAYYEGWIDSYRGRTVRGLEDTTRNEYRRSFESHVLPHLGRVKLRDLGSRDVSDWFGDLEREGVKPPTIRKAKAALSAMTATAAQDGEISSNPVLGVRYVPAVRMAKQKRRNLTVADVDAILDALPAQWRLFFELLAHSGLRIGELLGLTWGNVHLGDECSISVTEQVYKGERKRLKTEGSARRVPLSAGMARSLTAWKDETDHPGQDSPVFPSAVGTPLTYSNIYNRVLHPALQAAGIAVKVGEDPKTGKARWDYQGVGFHAFRKACGSILLLRAGKSPKQVQGWLGHSQLTTTMNIYVNELDDGLGGADDLDGILGAVGDLNEQMRDNAREEVAAGSTCPAVRKTAGMTDAEFAEWDERIAAANLRTWREAGMSEADIESEFAKTFAPPVIAAYRRLIGTERGHSGATEHPETAANGRAGDGADSALELGTADSRNPLT